MRSAYLVWCVLLLSAGLYLTIDRRQTTTPRLVAVVALLAVVIISEIARRRRRAGRDRRSTKS